MHSGVLLFREMAYSVGDSSVGGCGDGMEAAVPAYHLDTCDLEVL